MSDSNIVEMTRDIAHSIALSGRSIKNKVTSPTLLIPLLVFMGVIFPRKILSETYEKF